MRPFQFQPLTQILIRWFHWLVLGGSILLWPIATYYEWIKTEEFISHVSMAAWIYAAIIAVQQSCADKAQKKLAAKVDKIAKG